MTSAGQVGTVMDSRFKPPAHVSYFHVGCEGQTNDFNRQRSSLVGTVMDNEFQPPAHVSYLSVGCDRNIPC